MLLCLLGLLCLPSCVTAALWEDQHCGGGWSEAEVTWRAVLTPFAVMADVVLISAYVCAHCGAHCR